MTDKGKTGVGKGRKEEGEREFFGEDMSAVKPLGLDQLSGEKKRGGKRKGA